VFVRRYTSIAEIPHVKATNATTLAAKVSFVRESLAERRTGRPATVKALSSSIDAMFPGGLADDARASIIQSLVDQQVIAATDAKVAYLPATG
jgi:hypothetical protein